MWAVVGGIENDRVVGEAEVVEGLEELADMAVMLHHAVAVLILPRLAEARFLDVGAEVHAGGIPPAEERLATL